MLDYSIIVVYLIATLVIGYFSGKNVHTVKEYTVSDRNFSNITLVATIFASWLGGAEIFGTAEKTYRYGIIFLLAVSGYSANMLIVSKWMAKRIAVFKDAMSLGDIMGTLYGKSGRVITGLCLMSYMGVVGAQIATIGYVCNIFLNISANTGIIVGCVTIMLYSYFGGIRAVTFTDVLQFAVLVVAMPIVISVMLNKAGGLNNLLICLPESHLYLSKTTQSYSEYIILFLVIALPAFDPPFIQRILMSKNPKQAEDSLFIAALMHFPFMVLVGIAGFAALVVLPNINPNVALPTLVNLTLPVGLKGVAVIGILAIVMSTADSYLNVIGISFSRDIVKTLYSKPISDKIELRIIRVSIVVFGLVSILAATSFSSIMDILFFTNNFCMPLIFAPMFWGVLGVKASPRACVIGVGSGVAFTAYWLCCVDDPTLVGGILPSIAISCAVMYLYYKIESTQRKFSCNGSFIFSRNNKKEHSTKTL